MNIPNLSKRVKDLRVELDRAQGELVQSPESLERLDEIQDHSRVTEITKQVIAVSSETQNSMVWGDKQLEAEVLRTKLKWSFGSIEYSDIPSLTAFKLKRQNTVDN